MEWARHGTPHDREDVRRDEVLGHLQRRAKPAAEGLSAVHRTRARQQIQPGLHVQEDDRRAAGPGVQSMVESGRRQEFWRRDPITGEVWSTETAVSMDE